MFCVFLSLSGMAQVKIAMEVTDQPSGDAVGFLKELPVSAPDSASAADTLNAWVEMLRLKGFWTASIDQMHITDSSATGILYFGEEYVIGRLKKGNVPEELLNATGLRPQFLSSRTWTWPEIVLLEERLLDYSANHGYPFASVSLDSIRLSGRVLIASLNCNPGPMMTFGEPVLEGNAQISKTYLNQYLGLMPGMPYDEGRVARAASRLRDLSFLTLKREPGIVFAGNQAVPHYFLESGKASRFDFVLGLLPRTISRAGDLRSSIVLTGTLNAELANAFGWGEQLAFRFEQLRPGTPQLNIQVNYPYVASLPVGIDLDVELQKFDTTFITLVSTAGLQYLFSGGNSVKAFWRNEASNLLSIDKSSIRLNRRLPEVLDVRNTTFGLEYVRQELDYRFNPSRGWRMQLKGAAGIKRVRRSSLIEDLEPEDDGFEYSALYDSLVLRSAQYRLQGDIAAFLPLSGRLTFLLNNRFGWLLTDQPVFVNEQFRLGGNRLLRGFDEQSIFATRYTVMTLEFRVLLDRNSRFFLFSDLAYLENVTAQRRSFDRPLGFGSGLTFDTPAGIFSISLAFGSRLGNPIDWAAPKIHFGYVSLF